MITGKEMEKLKIIPPDAQIYAQVKASWDKIAKPLDGLGQPDRSMIMQRMREVHRRLPPKQRERKAEGFQRTRSR